MTKTYFLGGAVSAIALLSASTAMADVTAQQVWDDWKSSLDIYGEGLSIGDEVMSGNTLTVSDLRMSMDDGDVSVTANMGDITFTENGDGTVTITTAETYPIEIRPDDDALIKVSINTQGLEMTVSDEADALTYDMHADRYAIVVDEIRNGDKTIDGDIQITVNNVNGTYTSVTDALRNISSNFSADSVDLLVDVSPSGMDDSLMFSGQLANLTSNATMATPLEFDQENPEDIFLKGLSVDGTYGFDSAAYIFDVDVEGEQTAGSVSVGAASTSVTMNIDEMSLNYGIADLAVDVNSGSFPLPINVTLDKIGVGFAMPMSATDDAAPFSLMLNVAELAVNEELWMLAPGGSAVPHDPISALIDVSGTGKWFFNLLNPEEAMAMEMAEVPGELNSLALNDLKLSALGALLKGQGSFTFDNSDLESFDGLPRPEGSVSAQLTGANALIDTLVEIGMVPEEQAMGARMMMGMFAATTGEDQLETKLEVNSEGHVVVNGQRMK